MTTILFDLDGTLIDSLGDITRAVNHTLAQLGRPERDPAEVAEMIGGGAAVLLEKALGPDYVDLLDQARGLFLDSYLAQPVQQTRFYPGIERVLLALSRRHPLGVATNKPGLVARAVASALDFPRLGLSVVAAADEAGARKPDPAVIRLALERLGAPADDVAYVGDMRVDVLAARACGARAIGVRWGFRPAEIEAAGADVLLDAPEALLSLFPVS